jgi:bifunctional UDP-N-acetylglucosamine pyrophosphorylase/glucosamine-1-phosphate N-acetyltransferase
MGQASVPAWVVATEGAVWRVGGLPLLELVLRALDGAGAGPVGVLAEANREAVADACAARALTLLAPGALLGALAAEPGPTLLLLRADLALLRETTLVALLAAHRDSGAAVTLLEESGQIAGGAALEVGPLRAVLAAAGEAGPLPALPELAALLHSRGVRVTSFLPADPWEARPVLTAAGLAEATRRLRERALAAALAGGALIEDAATTHLGPGVMLAPGARIRPFTILEGATRVGAGATIGPWARLVDVTVAPEAQVLDHCLLRDCVVGRGASVGPFAHVRPESAIGARAKVGNFVELKKTQLGDGAKAPHLSYLGDATIGPGVNIGAGTITCNYDGQVKHPTRIEAGAFVGSNTTLVAPLTVGQGAYLAAGSTITKDVPADALAVGRARQANKDGWARRRRDAREKR